MRECGNGDSQSPLISQSLSGGRTNKSTNEDCFHFYYMYVIIFLFDLPIFLQKVAFLLPRTFCQGWCRPSKVCMIITHTTHINTCLFVAFYSFVQHIFFDCTIFTVFSKQRHCNFLGICKCLSENQNLVLFFIFLSEILQPTENSLNLFAFISLHLA